jgi:hypothetical protein
MVTDHLRRDLRRWANRPDGRAAAGNRGWDGGNRLPCNGFV